MKALFNIAAGLCFSFALLGVKLQAQMCQNSKDTLYGLNSVAGTSGQITAINVNNAGTTNIGTAASSSVNANGIGFSQVDGRFYFFNQCASGTIEFISYDPLTGVKVGQTIPPATLLTSQKIRSGTVTNGGNGYYTLNPNSGTPYFYYYNIALKTWTTVTSSFVSRKGTVISDFTNLNSGDMAFDGNGNLWMLVSNSTDYALYRISSPVPTTVVASIAVDTMISKRANPITGVSFTGIGFNSAGVLYLTTGSGGGSGNNKLYKQSTVSGALTLIGSIPNGVGDDLTSCIFPVAVMPVTWISFTAEAKTPFVQLSWKVIETPGISGYTAEYSDDGTNWQTISTVIKSSGEEESTSSYSITHHPADNHLHYYRIVAHYTSNEESISAVRMVNDEVSPALITLSPNPANQVLYLNNRTGTASLRITIYDQTGRQLLSKILPPSQNQLSVESLPAGLYFMRLRPEDQPGKELHLRFIRGG